MRNSIGVEEVKIEKSGIGLFEFECPPFSFS
jgi:hypothetical protein